MTIFVSNEADIGRALINPMVVYTLITNRIYMNYSLNFQPVTV
jgi:hypothetical protein